ncbi:MAG: BFD-like (2Fe-2S) protein [Syntrophobacterales bacterium]|nr:MAG: BFD-like (2Fe-2S) protein [Syntrophobacterales bacterium]
MKDRAAEMICYCFNHTRGDIARDVMQNGRSLILAEIIAAKRLGACRCAVKNPKGT